MAGKQKPNIENLGKEMTNYKIISYKLIENTTAQGLFDENLSSDADWTTKRIAYWGAEGSVVIQFNRPCIIWRNAGNYYQSHSRLFRIYKDGIEVTSKITQYRDIAKIGWSKAIIIPEPGTYNFVANGALPPNSDGYRLDREWYLESMDETSEQIKKQILNTIITNNLFQKYVIPFEQDPKTNIYQSIYKTIRKVIES